jgi:putative Ca2+/H+ antiporter (TMEM165/GDT1 family)
VLAFSLGEYGAVLDPTLLASVFAVIFVAELPDKTALAALVLATRHKALPVFVGAALALTIQSLVAVTAGELLSLLPERAVRIGSGIVFLISAVFIWREQGDEDEVKKKDHPEQTRTLSVIWTVFTVVFVAEWGDLTQIGTAALAARYKAPLTVFLGATLALCAVTAIAVFVGNTAAKYINPTWVQRIAAVIFVGVGVALLFGVI